MKKKIVLDFEKYIIKNSIKIKCEINTAGYFRIKGFRMPFIFSSSISVFFISKPFYTVSRKSPETVL